MTVHLRVKSGGLEFDYEGPEEFLKSELATIINHVTELRTTTEDSASPITSADIRNNGVNAPVTGNGSGAQFSIITIAAKMNVTKGPDLVVAAAVYLTFVKKQDKFRREELHEVMKSATGYYSRDKHGSHLSEMLSSLIRAGKLIQEQNGVYALPGSQRRVYEAVFADA